MLDFSTFINQKNQINLAYTWDKKLESMRKEQKNGAFSTEDMQLMHYQETLQSMNDSNRMQEINAKLNAGSKLSADEIAYLQKNAPELYREYVEAEQEAESYKKQLKHCKTKEDVQRVKLSKVSSFMAEAKNISNNAVIPDSAKLAMMQKLLKKVMSTEIAHQEFTQSAAYGDMPTEAELRAEEKREAEDIREEIVVETEEQVEEVPEETPEEIPEENQSDVESEANLQTEAKDVPKDIRYSVDTVDVKDTASSTVEKPSFETVKVSVVDYLKQHRQVGGGLHLFKE